MTVIVEQAPAKINLALHVTGQRADGYHLLDTLVTFTTLGDVLRLSPAESDGFTLSGPFAAALRDEDPAGNLVIRARDGLRRLALHVDRPAPPVHIDLEKKLPVASGIGGGSADAAAALRGLMRLWAFTPRPEALDDLALSLGADVPMCIASRPLIARGIGEAVTAIALPSMPMLIVNPLKPVSTPQIFRLLTHKNNAPMALDHALLMTSPVEAIAPLRNDLQPPAEALEPDIGLVLTGLREAGASLARMSGSGATCFGLFPGREALIAAEKSLRARHPGWFIAATETLA